MPTLVAKVAKKKHKKSTQKKKNHEKVLFYSEFLTVTITSFKIGTHIKSKVPTNFTGFI